MQKINVSLKKYGIMTRMVFFFSLLVVVPFLILSLIIYTYFKNDTITRLGQSSMDTLSVAASSIHQNMKAYENASMSLYYDGMVDFLEEKQTTGEKISEEDIEEIKNSLTSCCYSNPGVQGAFLEFDGETYYGGEGYSHFTELVEEDQEEIESAGGRCLWYVSGELFGKADENKFIMARSLNGKETKNIGTLYLVISEKMIQDAMDRLSTQYADWYLTDADGYVIYSSQSGKIRGSVDISSLNPNVISEYQTLKDVDGASYVLGSSQLMDVGWFCLSRIELETMRQTTRKMGVSMLGVSIVYLLFLLCMVYLMRAEVFSPLRQLAGAMDDYARLNLERTRIEIYGVGEFRTLSEHFNNMTRRINELMTAYKQETDEKNRQKMNALQAQLTPHFVYNALNTIKWIAVLNQQETIQKLIESLVFIFMNAAQADDGNYTVRDELELVKNYAVIQNARFLNFELVTEVEDNCLDLKVHKFLLQPMVENAIVHGSKRGKIRNTIITVRIWADDRLHMEVEDNGQGFDFKAWKKNPVKKSDHTSIGLQNVMEIVRLDYGASYGVDIESEVGVGTKVSFLLPKIM